MPYIPNKDYPAFDSRIHNIVRDIFRAVPLGPSGISGERILELLGGMAFYLVKKTMPARRYWTLALQGGVLYDISSEMCSRLEFDYIKYDGRIWEDLGADLIKDIDSLAEKITAVAQDYQKAALPKSYDGAYAGLLNYCNTCIALRLAISGFDRNPEAFRKGAPGRVFLQKAAGVFHAINDKFYKEVARLYEDEQISKTDNGDLPEYKFLVGAMK